MVRKTQKTTCSIYVDILVFLLKFLVYKILRLQKIHEVKNLGMCFLVSC